MAIVYGPRRLHTVNNILYSKQFVVRHHRHGEWLPIRYIILMMISIIGQNTMMKRSEEVLRELIGNIDAKRGRGNTKTVAQGRRTRRPASDIVIMTPEEIAKICRRAKQPRDACLLALMYMSGRRIGELLPLQKKNFNVANPRFILSENKFVVSFTTFNEKSWRSKKQSTFSIERPVDNFYMKDEHKIRCYVIRWYEKIEPKFSTQGPSGLALWHFIDTYLNELGNEDYLFAPDSHSEREFINQPRAYNIIKGMDERLWLHATRHMCFTRMAELFKDDPKEMHVLTFHKRFESTLKYIKTVSAEDKLANL
jgi:integrase